MSDQAPSLAELRAELARVALKEDIVERTFEVVALVDAVAAPLGIHPSSWAGWPCTSGRRATSS